MTNNLTGVAEIDVVLERVDRRRFLHGTANQAAGMGGRYAGGLFTNFASSGGLAARKEVPAKSKVRKVGKYSNVVLGSFGSLIHLVIRTQGANITPSFDLKKASHEK